MQSVDRSPKIRIVVRKTKSRRRVVFCSPKGYEATGNALLRNYHYGLINAKTLPLHDESSLMFHSQENGAVQCLARVLYVNYRSHGGRKPLQPARLTVRLTLSSHARSGNATTKKAASVDY